MSDFWLNLIGLGNRYSFKISNYPARDGKVSFVSRTDIAEALSMVLSEGGHTNQIYEITGSLAYGFSDIATILSQTKDRNFKYNSISMEAYKTELRNYQLPETAVKLLVSMALGIQSGEFSYADDTLSIILNRPTRTLNSFLESL